MSTPTEGEVWLVGFDPAVGSEIQKTRPAIVINDPSMNVVALRVVVPLTSWQARFAAHSNKLRIEAGGHTGLVNDSAADVFQVRSVSTNRFARKLGVVASDVLQELRAGVGVVIGYFP